MVKKVGTRNVDYLNANSISYEIDNALRCVYIRSITPKTHDPNCSIIIPTSINPPTAGVITTRTTITLLSNSKALFGSI